MVLWLAVIALAPLAIAPHLGNPLRNAEMRALKEFVSGHSTPSGARVFEHDLIWAIWAVAVGRLGFIAAGVEWRFARRSWRRLRWPERTWVVGEGNVSLFAVAGAACGDPAYASALAVANEGRVMGDGATFDPMDLRPGWELAIPAGIARRDGRAGGSATPSRPGGLLEAEGRRWDLLVGNAFLPVAGQGVPLGALREALRAVHIGSEGGGGTGGTGGTLAWLRYDRSLPVWVDLALRHAAASYAALGRQVPKVRQVRADRWSVSVELGEGGELLSGQWESFGGIGTWWVLARNPENAALLARTDMEDAPVPLLVPLATSAVGAPEFVNLAAAGPLMLAHRGGAALGALLLENLGSMPWLDQMAVIVVGGAFPAAQVDARVAHVAEAGPAYEGLVADWPAFRGALVVCREAPRDAGASVLPTGMCMVVAGDEAA